MASKRTIIVLCLATILQFVNCKETDKENKCDKIKCPKGGEPVCAFNGECYQTFENGCLVKLENCQNPENDEFEIVKEGECDETDLPNCSSTEVDQDPECICYTRSYWNQCCTEYRQVNGDSESVTTCKGVEKQCTNAVPPQ